MIDPTGKELMAVDSAEFKEVKFLVEEKAKLGTLNKVYEIFGGYVNRSFGVEMTNNEGEAVDYFVRRYRATQAISDVLSEHELIAFCIERGLDMAAGLEKMEDGKTYTMMTNEEDGLEYPWAIYRYLYGEDPFDWINQVLSPEEDAAMGRCQANLHGSAYGFTGGEKEEPQIYEFLSGGKMKDHFIACKDVEGIPKRDRYDLLYRTALPYVCEMVDKAAEGLKASGMLEEGKGYKTVCHCDYHPSNVKWKDGECCGIFDFDWSKVDYRLFDICFGLVYTCTNWGALENYVYKNDGELDLERTKHYLKGYVEKTLDKGVLPAFTEEEKKAFPYMFLAGMLYLWNWCTDYYNFPEDYNEYEWHYYLEHIYLGIKFADEHIEDIYNVIASI